MMMKRSFTVSTEFILYSCCYANEKIAKAEIAWLRPDSLGLEQNEENNSGAPHSWPVVL